MSFRIRPIYRGNSAIHSRDTSDFGDDDPTHTQEYYEEVVQAIKNLGHTSQQNQMSAADLAKLIKSSSVNPEYNPGMQKSIDDWLKQKQETESKILTNTFTSLPGFSSRAVNGARDVANNQNHQAYMMDHLSKITSKGKTSTSKSKTNKKTEQIAAADFLSSYDARNDVNTEDETKSANDENDTENDADDDDDSKNNDDEKTKEQLAMIENARLRRVMAMSYPSRASMCRGISSFRTCPSSGNGIKLTTMGMSDGF